MRRTKAEAGGTSPRPIRSCGRTRKVRFDVAGKQAEAGDDAARLRAWRWEIALQEGDSAALLGCVSASTAHCRHHARLLLALSSDELSVRALHETEHIIMGHAHT